MAEDESEITPRQRDELLQVQVQLLLNRLESGALVIEENLTEIYEDLVKVALDKRGLPLLHTVSERVRSYARMNAMLEMARKYDADRAMAETSPLRNWLPPRVEVTQDILRQCAEERQFFPLAFNLYAEAMALLVVCGGVAEAAGTDLDREQAICAGSLVRVAKFMRSVLALAQHEDSHGDAIFALTRSIAESTVTVRYLIAKDEQKHYDAFVASSFGTERELYDIIQRNIAARGGVKWPIEEQMLHSIDHYCRLSGVRIEDASPKAADSGGGMRQRLDAIGESEAYTVLFRGPSHAVHGTWVDLLMRHLDYEGGKYSLQSESPRADSRILLPIAHFVLEAATSYLQTFYGEHGQLWPVYERIDDLHGRIALADRAHMEWRDAAWSEREADDSGRG